MDNVQWTIMVSASPIIYIVAVGDTVIVNYQLSIVHSLRNNLICFEIPLFLGKHAAAVLLHVKTLFPGVFLPGSEIGAEIPVQKFYAEFCRRSFCGLPHQLVVLIGTDEQAGGKTVKTAFGCLFCSLKKPHLVALAAPIANVLCHCPDKGPEGVIVLFNQRQVDGGGVLPEGVPPGPVLGKGVDIGVIPKAGDLYFVTAQHLDALIGAGGAADMQKRFHKKLSKGFSTIIPLI